MKAAVELDFCLLIPCYNNLQGLINSLKSVSYPNGKFMILVIDDGSEKAVEVEAVKDAIGKELPLTVLVNQKNEGITKALNKGLAWIEANTNSRYIARLDCGDLCDPERFEMQVQYLDAHPETGLTGTWCRFIDEKTSLTYNYTASGEHEAISRELYFRNVFMHATVMFRTKLLATTGYYPTDYEYAEDYAFFWKLAKASRTYIHERFLVTCFVNRTGISFKNKGKQLDARWKVVKNFSTNQLRSTAAFLKIRLLHLVPNEVALRLKKIRS